MALDASQLRDPGAACVIDLARDWVAEWCADEDIYPASVIKLALMTETYIRFSKGSLRLDQSVVVRESNLTATAEATPLVAGYTARLGELVALMIERSDNIATNVLIDVLRRERVTASMRDLGLGHFFLGRKLSGADPLIDDPEETGRNSLTPREAAQLLRLIALDAVPGAAEQRTLLSCCTDNDRLAAGLRAGDRFMHKTGETSSVSHDAGILQTAEGGAYIIVLYTSFPPEGELNAARINPRMTRWIQALRPSL